MPSESNGADAVNFRQLQESTSLHLERQHSVNPTSPGGPGAAKAAAAADTSLPGTPGLGGDDGMDISPQDADLFGAFSSITLHYDGES